MLEPREVPSSSLSAQYSGDASHQENAVGPVQRLDIRFTGSGSEYFRIWIVNLILTLVTLGLYWPFARARRMVYFHNNTVLGEDALGFHADPWKMFRGYLLMLALGGLYWGLTQFSRSLAWLPILVMALLWPMLWHSSLVFRLRNTSWRGVRFDFLGSLRGAYSVVLPLFLPALLLVAVAFLAQAGLIPATGLQPLLLMMGMTVLAFVLVLPWLMAGVFAYQHSGYVFTAQRAALPQHQLTRSLYVLFIKLLGLLLCLSLVLGTGAWLLLGEWKQGEASSALVLGASLAYLFMPLVAVPYLQTRVQNLLWSKTRSKHVRIRSALSFRDMLMLNSLNWLLVIVTLGLYWPFAAVRMARLRLESVSVWVQGDVNTWVAKARAQQPGVLGDAAGDFFGVDMGM